MLGFTQNLVYTLVVFTGASRAMQILYAGNSAITYSIKLKFARRGEAGILQSETIATLLRCLTS